jgi:regulator of protease activity HflC (stomatin/prohibitin superfamily)
MFLIPGLYQVPEGHVAIAERFGKFDRILSSGLNFVNPLTTSVKGFSTWKNVATKYNYYIELAQQQLETDQRQCQTKDNVMVRASATISWRILNPKAAAYAVDILPDNLKDICSKVLRAEIGCILFDEIFSKRQQISENVTKQLSEQVDPWGISLNSVEVGELSFDNELGTAMKKRRIAEAEKDAKIAKAEEESQTSIKAAKTQIEKEKLESEGQFLRKKIEAESQAICLKLNTESEVAATIAKAKGIAETKKLESEAETAAFSIKQNAEAEAYTRLKEAEITYLTKLREQLGAEGTLQLLSYRTAVEGLKAIGENNNNKIMFLPNNMKSVLNTVIGVDESGIKPFLALPGQ